MKLVKENIKFERNQDPKDAMNTGMSSWSNKEKVEFVTNELNRLFDLDVHWITTHEIERGLIYTILNKDQKNRLLYAELVNGKFNSWGDQPETSNPIEAIKNVIDALYPNIEEEILKTKTHLEQVEKMKTYLAK